MAESAVSVIERLISGYQAEPPLPDNEHAFKKRSYSRWAAYEILNLIMDRPLDDPIGIVISFMLSAEIYSYECRNPESRYIFTIAKETAEDILDLL